MKFRTTAEAFDDFDDALKLAPKERAAAEACHTEVTALLIAAGIIVSAFLQGSFRRKTMIKPLRDVDEVVILAARMRGMTPDQVMDAIEKVIAAAYPDVTFDRTRHALQVDFGPTSFYFDIVPAWETETDDDDVLIANRDTGEWDRSNTRQLIRLIAERNDDTNGRFIHQARMGKQGIKTLVDGDIPGLHVESWAFDDIKESLAHDEACARILETGAELLGQTYYEPTGAEAISRRLKPEVIAKVKPVLAKAAADARRAVRLAAEGKHEAAIATWHGIFGDEFPAASSGDAAALRASFLGAGVTAAGGVSRAGTQRSNPTRSWHP